MKALLRNDLRWAGPLALLGTVVHLGALMSEGPQEYWAFPENRYSAYTAGFLAIAVAVIALFSALFDEVTRTREYLLHRPVSAARVFWTRQVVWLGVVLVWVVVDPSLHLLGSWLWSDNWPIFQANRWPMFVAHALPALFLYALVLLAATVSRHFLTGTLLALGLGLVVSLSAAAWLFIGPAGANVWVVVLSLLLTPPLLLAAACCHRDGRDADRPWSQRRLVVAGTPVVLLAVLAGSVLLTAGHAIARRKLHGNYPLVVRTDDTFTLARRPTRKRPLYQEVDRQHQPVRLLPEVERTSFAALADGPWQFVEPPFSDHRSFPRGGFGFRGVAYSGVLYGPSMRSWAGSDGYIHFYRFAQRDGQGEDRPVTVRLGRARPGQPDLPFSPKARTLFDGVDGRLVVVEPEDGTLWALGQSDEPKLRQLQFPDGDRFVALADPRTRNHGEVIWSPRIAVEGGRGIYVLEDGRLVPAPAGKYKANPERRSREVTQHSATSFTVSIAADERRPGFEHRYDPRTFWEHTWALASRAPTLLRPLPLSLASLAVQPRTAFGYFGYQVLDQPITLGDPAALAGNVSLSLLLAGLGYRRLGRLGATRGRRLWWAGAVLLGGGPALVCLYAIETGRAWRPMTAPQPAPAGAPAPAGPLLLFERT